MARRSTHLVAFQGEPGAFSHAAAMKLLGNRVSVFPCPSFRDVFEALQSGKVEHAVIPIENTLHGSVHENYDYLLEYEHFICGETQVRISHYLIARPGVRFRDVKRVFSHPVALNQCRRFFAVNEQVVQAPFYDTAGSVKMVIEKSLGDAAAIASETSATLYGGQILRRNLEDDRQNYTRFFLLTKQQPGTPRSLADWKTSIVFSISNVPGALFKAIACFALRDLDLTKIESRPLRGKPWEYLFYIDIKGHQRDLPVESALANLKEMTAFVRVLGSYKPTP